MAAVWSGRMQNGNDKVRVWFKWTSHGKKKHLFRHTSVTFLSCPQFFTFSCTSGLLASGFSEMRSLFILALLALVLLSSSPFMAGTVSSWPYNCSSPTTNIGMQNGSSVGIRTHCTHVFARLTPTQLVLLNKISSSELSRKLIKSCWLGVHALDLTLNLCSSSTQRVRTGA